MTDLYKVIAKFILHSIYSLLKVQLDDEKSRTVAVKFPSFKIRAQLKGGNPRTFSFVLGSFRKVFTTLTSLAFTFLYPDKYGTIEGRLVCIVYFPFL